jgi:hypothetical protein
MVTVHRAPRRQKAYIQCGMDWFPKGIIYGTAVTTLVPRSLQHDTFQLGLGRPEPHYPVCVIVTLDRVSPPHLLLPATWPWGRNEGLDLWEAFGRYVVLWLLVEGSYAMKVDAAGSSEMVMTTCESIQCNPKDDDASLWGMFELLKTTRRKVPL